MTINKAVDFIEKCQDAFPSLYPVGYGFLCCLTSTFLGYGNGYSWINGELASSCNNQEDTPLLPVEICHNYGIDVDMIAPEHCWETVVAAIQIPRPCDKSKLPYPNGCQYCCIFSAPASIHIDHFAAMLYCVGQFEGDFPDRNPHTPFPAKLVAAFKRFLAYLWVTSFQDRVAEVQQSIHTINAAFEAQLIKFQEAKDFDEQILSWIETNLNNPTVKRLRSLYEAQEKLRFKELLEC